MDWILSLHSLVRWLVLLSVLIGVFKTLVSLIQKTPVQRVDQTLASAFLGLYDLQVLLGLLIILLGGLTQAIHPIIMVIGVVVAHWFQALTRRNQEERVSLSRLGLYLIPLAIILAGLATINHLPL